MRDKNGRTAAYGLRHPDKGEVTVIPARDAILYRHNMGGGKPRGLSDLHRAIRNLHDEADIVGYVKQSAKLAASVGLVETGARRNGRAWGPWARCPWGRTGAGWSRC